MCGKLTVKPVVIVLGSHYSLPHFFDRRMGSTAGPHRRLAHDLMMCVGHEVIICDDPAAPPLALRSQ